MYINQRVFHILLPEAVSRKNQFRSKCFETFPLSNFCIFEAEIALPYSTYFGYMGSKEIRAKIDGSHNVADNSTRPYLMVTTTGKPSSISRSSIRYRKLDQINLRKFHRRTMNKNAHLSGSSTRKCLLSNWQWNPLRNGTSWRVFWTSQVAGYMVFTGTVRK